MAFKHPRFANAVSLTEVVVAMTILAIATLGGVGYQYYAARHSRIARAEIIGTRTAQLLLEDWKSTGGSTSYNPSSLGLGFSSALSIPAYWSEGEEVGAANPLNNAVYAITVDNVPMQVMLQWEDVDSDTIAKVTLRELSVTVRFVGTSENADESEYIPPVILTTYVTRR